MSDPNVANWQKWKIEVDRDACASCGNCTQTAEEVFKLDDQGISTVIPGGLTEETAPKALEAMHECPTQAIIITEE